MGRGFRFLDENGRTTFGMIKGVGEVKVLDAPKPVEAKPEVIEEAPKELAVDPKLDAMSMGDLKKKAKELGLKYPKNTKKGELVDMIESHLEVEPEL